MTLKLYNTLTASLTDFVPLKEGQVGLYACGPTVYDHAHVGHARAVVAFDMLVRHLSHLGFKVTYVRNYTDVDDKIINRAKELGSNWQELTEIYINSFEEDMSALNCLSPTFTPKATEYIKQMLEDILEIKNRGLAYQIEGDVYFDVASLEGYGRLSGRLLEDQEAGSRVTVDGRKKNPGDFALWKSAKPGEPSWPSPFGPGRPGWHIECSTMSARLLGPSFDIHGGGQDLIFPHHENELAQSQALDRPMATIWTHNGFVNVNNEKMSKSIGNFKTIKDIFKEFSPEVLRYFLTSKHYRSPIEFAQDGLKDAEKSLERIFRTVILAQEYLSKNPLATADSSLTNSVYSELKTDFYLSLDDDLNTAKALGFLFNLVHNLNADLNEGKTELVANGLAILLEMGDSFGLKLSDPKIFFDNLNKGKSVSITPTEIEEIIKQREAARLKKDYGEADRLRKFLTDQKVVLEDKGGQTTWRYL
jgi:cysteinyl-tRNA synthetase